MEVLAGGLRPGLDGSLQLGRQESLWGAYRGHREGEGKSQGWLSGALLALQGLWDPGQDRLPPKEVSAGPCWSCPLPLCLGVELPRSWSSEGMRGKEEDRPLPTLVGQGGSRASCKARGPAASSC